MDWLLTLIIILGSLFLIIFTRIPVAFAFLALNLVGMYLLFGGINGLHQLVMSMSTSIGTFTLVPIPLFILMGEVLFHSGMGTKCINVLDQWMGNLPGRLGLITVGASIIFSAMSGSSSGTIAMLGSTMTPEMDRRGYKKPISLGAAMSGGVDAIIPPSGLAILLGALAEISIGKLLIGGMIPGLMMSLFYAIYIFGRCVIQPSMAPPYSPEYIPLRTKLINTARYLLPFFAIIILVLGVIFLGIATPTESAAVGAFAAFVLAFAYGTLNWNIVKRVAMESMSITVMLFMVLAGATAFSQVMAISGAAQGFGQAILALNLSPFTLLIVFEIIVFILGFPMDGVSLMLILFPIFLPLIKDSGIDMILFGIVTLINIELAGRTPPFGMILYVMQAVAPPGTTSMDVWKASIPFCLCDLLSLVVILCFPIIVLFLPNLMAS